MTSLCDGCFDPGRCCKRFVLSKIDGDEWTQWDDEAEEGVSPPGLPFTAVNRSRGPFLDEESMRFYSTWRYNCGHLSKNGRCGIYSERPDVCRDYAPMQDALCVHWRGAEGGE